MSESPLEGDKVVLRAFEPDDAPALAAYLNDPVLAGRRYIPWAFPDVLPLSRQQVEGIIQEWGKGEHALHLAVVRRERGDLIGHADCDWEWDPHCPSLGVVIAPAHQRRGYGAEVAGLLLRHLFEDTVAHVVTCWISDWNEAARRFAAGLGFREGGQMRCVGKRQGRYYHLIVADLLRSEWQQRGGGAHAPGR